MGATSASTAPVIKSYLVKPDGFEISKKATNFHNISHEAACQEGVPLREVPCLFMEDVIKNRTDRTMLESCPTTWIQTR